MIGPLQFRRRVPGRSIPAILWFDVCRFLVECTLRVLYRYRVLDRRRIPREGAVLVVANHVSFLDPMLVGSAMSDRQFSPMARDTLFMGFFGRLLRSYGCIPVRREGGDAAAMKAALGELAAGRCVAIFPEGTRSEDGTMQPFRRGVLLLVRRARVRVVPMGVAGSHEAWPKGRSRPRLRGRVVVAVGEAIEPAAICDAEEPAALAMLEQAVGAQAARARQAVAGRRPPPDSLPA